MRFWIREIAGWLLVVLGLYFFAVALSLVMDERQPMLLHSGPPTLIGIILFRGGIHLLKVAMAARICLHVHADAARAALHPREGK